MITFHELYFIVYLQFRSFLKWILRKTTKLCELQRICYGMPSGCSRSQAVEYSLNYSKSLEIKAMTSNLTTIANEGRFNGRNQRTILEKSVMIVLQVKKINPHIHRQFIISFTRCLEHIWGYQQLIHEVETLRLLQFDSSVEEHENKLTRLWTALQPDVPLESRISRQWTDIGFQGDDPKTDFRGMGLLGLDNLVFFAEEYTEAARHVLSHSQHPQFGYSFAIVGINITSMAYNLLKDGAAKTHVYNTCKSVPSMRIFHQFYCYLFYEFDRFWIESKPKNVMQFSYIRNEFENNIRDSLSNQSTVFNINFVVNTV
ncbi:hypothetical protein O3M35_010779 [Rhynocoris fuscipes]|uniref:ELMO domain-containing protein n=1 Tax=Rhynocoris fuscipes TaxID=488301 RepID=A0AAW1D5R5_9HEMI